MLRWAALFAAVWASGSERLSLASVARNFDVASRGTAVVESYEQANYTHALELCNVELLQHPGSVPAHSAIAIISAAIAESQARERGSSDALVAAISHSLPQAADTKLTKRFTLVVFTAIFSDDPYSIRDLLKPIPAGFNESATLQLGVGKAAYESACMDNNTNSGRCGAEAEVDVDVEFICFTNSYRVVSHEWQVKYVPSLPEGGGRLSARYYKIMSHAVLPESKYR